MEGSRLVNSYYICIIVWVPLILILFRRQILSVASFFNLQAAGSSELYQKTCDIKSYFFGWCRTSWMMNEDLLKKDINFVNQRTQIEVCTTVKSGDHNKSGSYRYFQLRFVSFMQKFFSSVSNCVR